MRVYSRRASTVVGKPEHVAIKYCEFVSSPNDAAVAARGTDRVPGFLKD